MIKASEAKKEEESKNLNTLVELKRMFTFKPFILLSISAISARSMIQVGYIKNKTKFVNWVKVLIIL